MHSRREFLGSLAAPAVALAAFDPARAAALRDTLAQRARDPRAPEEIAGDEDFWADIARAFTVDRSLVNLNNGGVSPSPRWVQDAMQRHLALSNSATAHTMWQILEPQKENVRQRLALQFGCDAEEIAITRNASEGLQICQLGFDLARGDVVLTTDQDYPRMLTTFEQRARREGIDFVKFPIPAPIDDPGLVTQLFVDRMRAHRPKLVLMCHMLSGTGGVLPVREVVAAARELGIPVIVDGAHSFAHLDFHRDDLGSDYFATSLHKWLSAPHGTGMLFSVRKERIRGLWPLMAAAETQDDDIRKFEEIGTHPAANTLAIGEALTFHQTIGAARKLARLVYLREYRLQRLLDRYPDRFTARTSRAPGWSGAIATVEMQGVVPTELAEWLFRAHGIVVTPIEHPSFRGFRVSPSVYTTREELDRFVAAVERVVHHGLPAKIAK